MKKIFTITCLITFLFSASKKCNAQLFVDTVYSVPQMVTDFFGNTCTAISNITYQGTNQTMNFFDGSNSNVGLTMGILLTSGQVMGAVTNNLYSPVSTAFYSPGDSSLDQLVSGSITNDASVIEFDITPTVDTMFFEYVFASEEYNDWVGTSFNDVFGFFISGPGYSQQTNIALIPGTTIPVAINNVNCGINGNYYVCNDIWNPNSGGCTSQCPLSVDSTSIEYDGFTTPLSCFAIVQPDSTYHVKIAVADVADAGYDSGIFLSANSLCGDGMLPHPIFNPSSSGNNSVSFPNLSIYAVSYYWDFGDGSFSIVKNPVHQYASPGIYSVTLTATNGMGSVSTEMDIDVNYNGIEELENQSLVLSPNPANDILNVLVPQNEFGDIYLYDAVGKLISVNPFKGNTQLQISNLPKGIYVLKAKSMNGTFVKKFVKN